MDQAATLRDLVNHRKIGQAPAHSKRGMRVVSITSGKGGVGKTNVVVNLCLALARQGQRVMLLDADMGLANVDVLLGLTARYTLEHVMTGQKELADVVLEGPDGLRVLPSSSGISDLAEMSGEQQALLFQKMKSLDGELDYLFIDTGAGISSNILRFNASADEILVISNPEPTAITDAYALMKLLSIKYHLRRFSLVANSVGSEAEGQSVYSRLNQVCSQFLHVNLSYLGSIPFDQAVRKAVRLQKPVLSAFPSSPASRGVINIAKRLHRGTGGEDPASAPAVSKTGQAPPAGFWDRLLHWKKVK